MFMILRREDQRDGRHSVLSLTTITIHKSYLSCSLFYLYLFTVPSIQPSGREVPLSTIFELSLKKCILRYFLNLLRDIGQSMRPRLGGTSLERPGS